MEDKNRKRKEGNINIVLTYAKTGHFLGYIFSVSQTGSKHFCPRRPHVL
jgi:hypothetical protein